jgi:hypothetical protein
LFFFNNGAKVRKIFEKSPKKQFFAIKEQVEYLGYQFKLPAVVNGGGFCCLNLDFYRIFRIPGLLSLATVCSGVLEVSDCKSAGTGQ